MQIESFYFCIPCSLSGCITEIIPGHNVCKHSLKSCLQNKSYSYIYKGQIDEILLQTKMKQRSPMECCRSPDFGHTSCLKEWLTPELYKFQQNLRFSIGNKGGVGFVLCMAGWWRIMCTAAVGVLHQWSKLQLPKDVSRAGILLYILENHRGLYWLSIQIISSILKLLSTGV
jgi:hypothetical protein